MYTTMKHEGRTTTILYENVSFFIFLGVEGETDGDKESKTDSYIDP